MKPMLPMAFWPNEVADNNAMQKICKDFAALVPQFQKILYNVRNAQRLDRLEKINETVETLEIIDGCMAIDSEANLVKELESFVVETEPVSEEISADFILDFTE